MRAILTVTAALALALPFRAEAQNAAPALYVGGSFGFLGGPGGQVYLLAHDVAEGLGADVRFGIGRSHVEPGSAAAARRIFINNATNGTPVEHGSTTNLTLDAVVPMGPRSFVYAGVRHTRFKANFKYVGGNEDFDVTSSHWGLAGGLEARFPVNRRVALVVSGGGEYFFPSRLTGHDTSYARDGDDVNPREDYTYADADEAVAQPTWRPAVAVGVSYRLGS